MSIAIEKEGRYFIFYSTGTFEFPLYFYCRKCKLRLGREYSYIIWKLTRANLLPTGYKTLCCRCSLIQKVIDNSKCPECKSLLDYSLTGSDKTYYTISCIKCKFKKAVFL